MNMVHEQKKNDKQFHWMQDQTSYILTETKSMLLERKEVKQGHEMRWLKS